MKTVHIILNAHLDPVWLWSWREGLDEVLNTSHYICRLLDKYPEIIYTRGEAWVYEQIQKIDAPLFERIRAHVRAGRWHIVGGWHIQPDCNLPEGFAMERQIALGKDYFLREFGLFPDVAYNVDSFGHAATLPSYMHAAGQSSYVMMRPQENEMRLPSRLFRWRGYSAGPEVTAFRIAQAYCTPEGMNDEHVLAALSQLPEGISHTMCFAGVGDHGGGPTEEIIRWCIEHHEFRSDVRLEFSTPTRFFQAVRAEAASLPLVVGELQQHAVGCYSVHRPVKLGVRRAEHLLRQAECAGVPSSTLEPAWKRVCFNHFHDTLGGTCLPSAYEAVQAELGAAYAVADEAAALALRRQVVQMPGDIAQRLVFFNASEQAFDDIIEIEPWLEWTPWQATWGIVDESRQLLPLQTLAPETAFNNQTKLLFPLRIAPKETRVIRIVDRKEAPQPPPVSFTTSVDLSDKTLHFAEGSFPMPRLVLFDDATDTWSHGVDRYPRTNSVSPEWDVVQTLDHGPIMTAFCQSGRIGSSQLRAEWRVYAGFPWVELRLHVLWVEKRRMLKLEWTHPAGIASREDGIMGGSLIRSGDGRELPFRDWTLLRPREGMTALAMIAPEIFALDGDGQRVGLTLLRSCAMACHEPNPGTDPRTVFSDQGCHTFRFRLLAGNSLTANQLDVLALGLHRPPLHVELTRGMKTRAYRNAYLPSSLSPEPN